MSLKESKRALESVGYRFNEMGQLRSIDEDGPYKFEVKHGDKHYNQAAYENIGKIVDNYIFHLLVEQEGLLQVKVPLECNDKEEDPTSFVFHSPDLPSYEKLLVLIHGSGVVRAGQWSRRLIINHSLESGSQIPYIQHAKQLGYGILVMNSNQNRDTSGRIVRGSETPEAHFNYVWKNIVQPSKVEDVAIVAHSYGGVITINGAAEIKDVAERTFAVAFTDSVHSIQGQISNQQYKRLGPWIKDNIKNWVSSSKPLNEEEYTKHFDCPRVSAGTSVHEETSWKSFGAVWEFIEQKANRETSNLQGNSKAKDKAKEESKPKTKQSKIADYFKKNQHHPSTFKIDDDVAKTDLTSGSDSNDVDMESQKDEL